MQAQVGHVIAGRIPPIKTPVDHVRNPCKRVPVPGIVTGKRPPDALDRQPLLHIPVFQNIVVIVNAEEIVAPHSAICNHGHHSKQDAHSGNLPRLSADLADGNAFLSPVAGRAFVS